MADCLGSLLVYDILTTTIRQSCSSSSSLSSSLPSSPSVSPRSSEHVPPGAVLSTTAPALSSPLSSRKKLNVALSSRSGSSDDVGRRSPLLHGEAVDDVEDYDHQQTAFFSFDVSHVFAKNYLWSTNHCGENRHGNNPERIRYAHHQKKRQRCKLALTCLSRKEAISFASQ